MTERPPRPRIIPATARLPRHTKPAKRIADEKAEVERCHRVATHLLCEVIVTVAQMRGLDTARKYRADMALPGRSVTMETLLDARKAIEEIIAIWKEEGFHMSNAEARIALTNLRRLVEHQPPPR